MRRWLDAGRLLSTAEPGTYTIPSIDQRQPALAEVFAAEAGTAPDLVDWRNEFLPTGRLVDEDEQVPLLKALFFREPREVAATVLVSTHEHVTIGEPVEGHFEERQVVSVACVTSGGTASVRGSVNGPIGQLAAIAERLRASYHWATAADGVTFILTGKTPPIASVLVTLAPAERPATSRITIEVDPRTPARQVKQAYETARSHPAIANLAGSPTRPLEDRTERLAVFLAHHADRSWSWSARLNAWNRRYPEWQYPDPRRFDRAAKRAWKRVTGEGFAVSISDQRKQHIEAAGRDGVPLRLTALLDKS